MAITKVEFTYKKPNLRFDQKLKQWVGYRIDIRIAGRRYRDLFPTRSAAEQFIDTAKQNAPYVRAGLKPPAHARTIRLRDLVDARLRSITTRKRRELESRVLEYFLDLVDEFKAVTDLTVADLRLFVDTRSRDLTVRNEPVKPQTVDRELTIIAAALHNAGEYFEELSNYTAPKIPRLRFKKGRRERIITDHEKELLLKELWSTKPEIARIFEFATLTGMRHTEIMRVRKTDLDRKARSLKVERLKTDSVSYLSPLTDRMLELLEGSYPSGYVFTKDGRTPPLFYRILKAACEKCGIPYGRFTPGGVILHDTRHSFITKLQQAGIDLATIQSFSGHSDKHLVMNYSHARPESRRRAMNAIDPAAIDQKLRKIYDDIAAGKLTFEEFVEAIS